MCVSYLRFGGKTVNFPARTYSILGAAKVVLQIPGLVGSPGIRSLDPGMDRFFCS